MRVFHVFEDLTTHTYTHTVHMNTSYVGGLFFSQVVTKLVRVWNTNTTLVQNDVIVLSSRFFWHATCAVNLDVPEVKYNELFNMHTD